MRKILFSTLAATVVAAAGCGGDSGTGPAAISIAGTYALKTVNTASLPFTMPDDGTGKVEILSDSYTLTDGGKYTGVTQVRITLPGGSPTVTNVNSQGTFTKSGGSVTLTDSVDPTDKVTGTLNGTTLTISVDGFVLVYQQSGS